MIRMPLSVVAFALAALIFAISVVQASPTLPLPPP